jgi:NAD(P)H-dependent FMN reductase
MKYSIIIGSHRQNSQSTKVGQYISDRLKAQQPEADIYILDLAGNPLPLWDEGRWSDDPKWDELWSEHSRNLAESDAFVVVTPEWGGMATPGLKNFFLLCQDQELAHKPAMLVGLSASRNGAYPLAELRMSSYKNTRICYIPDQIIVRSVGKVLNHPDFDPEDKEDYYVKNRIDYTLGVLQSYARAFQDIRQNTEFDYQNYPFGM